MLGGNLGSLLYGYVSVTTVIYKLICIIGIVGGNAGVGLETAVDMATRGARVILGCRNEERAQKAVQIIKGLINFSYSKRFEKLLTWM